MKPKIIFTFILSVITSLTFAQQEPSKKLMQQLRYQEAIAWLEKQPETTENLLLIAENQQRLYDYYGATLTYEKVLAQDSTQLPIIIALAETSYKDGDANKSLMYWTKALQLYPDNIYLKTNKAIAHYRKGDWRETIESSQKVFETDSVSLLLRMSGDASLKLLNDSALFYYSKAIEKNPSDHIAVNRLANLYYSTNSFSEAIKVTGNYLDSVNPHQKSVGQLHGMALYSNGDYEKAIERLELNTQLGDSSYTTSFFLGMSYYATKLYDTSIPWFENAYRIKSDDINLLFYYGTALSRIYETERALVVLNEGVTLLKKQMEILYDYDVSFANTYLNSGKHSEAVKHFKSALKRKPEETKILYHIAHSYDIVRDLKNALHYYERFLETKPQNMDITEPVRTPKNKDNLEQFYYYVSAQQIEILKEELFFKKGHRK